MRTSSPNDPSDRAPSPASWRHGSPALAVTAALSAAALTVQPIAVTPATAAPSAPTTATVDRVLADPRITESSGLTVSTRNPNVLLTHNDSGDRPRLYAVGRGGATRAVLRLRNASAVDWEDIATGPDGTVWVGDIGDDDLTRSNIAVYRAQEPAPLTTRTIDSTRYRLRYPDGVARDAEGLLVHPGTGRVYVVTNAAHAAAVYAAPAALSPTGVNTLRRVASAPASVTAASFAPDGSHIVLGTKDAAFVSSAIGGDTVRVAVPPRRRGESLGLTSDGQILVGSEGRHSVVLALPDPLHDGPASNPSTPTNPMAPGTPTPPTVPSAPTLPTTTAADIEVPGWSLDLNEEFDTVDPKRWNVRNNTYNSNEHSYLLARNTTTRNSVLRIQGKREPAGNRAYTSGYLDTNRKYSVPDYFRAEVRAKVPMEQGMWAAPLWFRPTDGSGGEIDLIETYGRDRHRPLVHQTIHTNYGSSHQQSVRESHFSRLGDTTGTQWHTYTVEKVPGRIVMWVDGVRTATFRSGDPNWFDRYYEAGKSWNLRVNLQIGGDWGGLPDSSTDWTPDKTAMQIDYIRTWKRQ